MLCNFNILNCVIFNFFLHNINNIESSQFYMFQLTTSIIIFENNLKQNINILSETP